MWKLALSLLLFLLAAAPPPDRHNPSNLLASRDEARQSLACRLFALLTPRAAYAQEDFDDAADNDADGDSAFDDDDAMDDFAENDDSEDESDRSTAERDDRDDDNDRSTTGLDDSREDNNGFTTESDEREESSDRLTAGQDDDQDDNRSVTGRDERDEDSDRLTAGRDSRRDNANSQRDDDDDFAFDDADDDGDSDDLELDDPDDNGGTGAGADEGFEADLDLDSDDNGGADEAVAAENEGDAEAASATDALARGGADGGGREAPSGSGAAAAAGDTFISLENDSFIDPEDNPSRLDNIAEDPDGDLHINGEMLVLVDATEYNEIVSKLQYRIIAEQRIKTLGQVLVRLQVPTRDFQTAAALISANAPGASIDYNHTYDLSNAAAPRSTDNIRRDSRIALNGARARIGMIDSGVDRFHPSLKQADLVIRDFSPQNTRQSFSHGTAIASLIVGDEANRFTGLMPEATLYAASVFGVSGKGRVRSTTEDLIRAIDWLTANAVPVISMSFAGPKNILLERIIKTASARGFTFIAAVGNDGPNAEPRFPSAYASVIAVTAVDENSRIYRRAVTGAHVEFSAPGVRVLAADDKNYAYANFTGSSFAAPYVAALIAARMPEHDPAGKAGVIDFYRKTAMDLGQAGRDNIYGFGLITY